MNNLFSTLKSKFGVDILKEEKNQVWVKTDKEKLLDILSFLKKDGFQFFSSLSAVDILEKNIIELIYHIRDEKRKKGLNIKVDISRESPEIKSASDIYPACQIHEREIHELFGVNFLDNPNLSELFLEKWTGRAPFLKDFDWRKYVREKFYNKENENEKGYYDQ